MPEMISYIIKKLFHSNFIFLVLHIIIKPVIKNYNYISWKIDI